MKGQSSQASDSDLTDLSSPTVNRFVYSGDSGYTFITSSTAMTNLGFGSVWSPLRLLNTSSTILNQLGIPSQSQSVITLNSSSSWLTQLGITAEIQSLFPLNSSSTIKTQLAADNIVTAGRSLTRTTDDIAADAELFTHSASLSMLNPSSTLNFTDGAIAFFPRQAITITEVGCHSLQAGTTTIQLDERLEVTPGTAGTDVLSAQIECGISTASTTAFANATIAANAFVNLDVDIMTGSPSSTALY